MEQGSINNIQAYDFKGLYPAIIMGYNICPTTFMGVYQEKQTLFSNCIELEISDNNYPEYKYVYYKKDTGILCEQIMYFVKMKDVYKKKYNETGDNIYMSKRQAVKIIANTFYGILGQ